MNQSLAPRALAAAVVIMLGATFALVSQPSASTAARTSDGGAHVFVPTPVAIEARDEASAPTF
jgi:hypothetical protein